MFEFPVRFPGQYADKETNRSYNYFRDYDPGIGRYGQADLLGLRGGLSLYSYVNGNPISYTDPTGESPLLILGGAVIVVGSAYVGYNLVEKGEAAYNLINSLQRAQQLKKEIEEAYDACVRCNDQAACRRYVELVQEYSKLPGAATNAGAGLSNVPSGGLPGKVGGAAGDILRNR